jgi:hypothetical protein
MNAVCLNGLVIYTGNVLISTKSHDEINYKWLGENRRDKAY